MCSCPALAPGWGRTCAGKGRKTPAAAAATRRGPSLRRGEHTHPTPCPRNAATGAPPPWALPLTGAVARGCRRHIPPGYISSARGGGSPVPVAAPPRWRPADRAERPGPAGTHRAAAPAPQRAHAGRMRVPGPPARRACAGAAAGQRLRAGGRRCRRSPRGTGRPEPRTLAGAPPPAQRRRGPPGRQRPSRAVPQFVSNQRVQRLHRAGGNA